MNILLNILLLVQLDIFMSWTVFWWANLLSQNTDEKKWWSHIIKAYINLLVQEEMKKSNVQGCQEEMWLQDVCQPRGLCFVLLAPKQTSSKACAAHLTDWLPTKSRRQSLLSQLAKFTGGLAFIARSLNVNCLINAMSLQTMSDVTDHDECSPILLHDYHPVCSPQQ